MAPDRPLVAVVPEQEAARSPKKRLKRTVLVVMWLVSSLSLERSAAQRRERKRLCRSIYYEKLQVVSPRRSMFGVSSEPTVVPLDLLREITGGFSEERKLGSGSYGEVYLGVHRDGQKIAVKLIYDMPGVDDKQFQNEFKNLTRLRHQNIVRLVGYCHDIQQVQLKHEGKLVLAEKTHRALCLEYMSNGSLENYLSDECDKYNWRTGYGIIKGICQGLKYLHNELKPPIYHLDLKPANVLLDENMVPRIADFGISRLFGDELTRATISSLGTVGYLPPEYIRNNLISSKFDIFSLGVVIIKIMAGRSGYFNIDDMSSQEFANLVQEKWTNRLHETSDLTKASSEQVKICIEIGLSCVQEDRHKRPAIQDIVDRLNETETECTHAARKNRLLFYQDSLGDTTQRGNIYSPNRQQATGGYYKLMNFGGVEELACSKIWCCSAPKKCKKFAWLLVKHRAKVRVVLKKQGIVDNDKCPFGCCAPETVSHLALECSRTKHIWGLLGVSFSGVNQPAGIFTDGMRFISEDKIKAWELVAIAVVWSVWLARNRRVFDGVTVPPGVVAKQCATMVKLWVNRAKKEELMAVRKWIACWPS